MRIENKSMPEISGKNTILANRGEGDMRNVKKYFFY